MSKPNPNSSNADENLRKIYEEVCNSYHGISDFRAKLLALLPIASGTGIIVALSLPSLAGSPHVVFVGFLGFVATLGLFFYELRGIQRCKGLIENGKYLEEKLGFPENAQFTGRPGRFLGFIGSETAGWTVYLAMLFSWFYVFVAGAIQIAASLSCSA